SIVSHSFPRIPRHLHSFPTRRSSDLVYAVPFDITTSDPKQLYPAIFERLLDLGLVGTGDQVIVTKGELSGVSGGTNSLLILSVADRKSTRLNSSHSQISYAVFCLKKK